MIGRGRGGEDEDEAQLDKVGQFDLDVEFFDYIFLEGGGVGK